MKTRTKIVSMLVLMVFCFSAYEAYAFGGPGGRGPEMKHLKWILAKAQVPLADDQKTQIKAIMKDSRDQTQEVRTSLKAARREVRDLILTGKASDGDIQAKVGAMTPLINQMALNRAQTFNKIVGLLHPDQLAALQPRSQSIQPQTN
jgi:Spy/CpxP family protein refolding chaperone